MLVPGHVSTRARRRFGRGIAITVLSLVVGLGVVSPLAAGAADSATTTGPTQDDAAATAPSATTEPPSTTEPPATTEPDVTTEPPVATEPPATTEPPLPATAPPAAAAPDAGVTAQAVPTPFTTAMRAARTALTTAVVYLTNRQNNFATTALTDLRAKLAQAHQLGMAHIGPLKVVEIFRFEHQIAMKLLPFFNGWTNGTVVTALQTTLSTTFANRTAMLTKVIAVPPEGPLDYDDALTDTLPIYTAEVKAYQAALAGFQLTAQARTALTHDLDLVLATRKQFTQRFGGGE
jgi:hypothetical protein